MPCDTITTQTLSTKLTKAMPDLIKKALESLDWQISTNTKTLIKASRGYRTTLTWEYGKGMTVQSSSQNDNQYHIKNVTQAYSKEAVSWAAQRAGWKVSQTEQNKLQLRKG